MLSYIVRLVQEFEYTHGVHPNLLYLNETHLQHLQQGLRDGHNLQHLRDMLHMDIIITRESVHPHVMWAHTAYRLAG